MKQPKPTIAVVENDSAVCEALDRLLRAAGFRTQSFPSAETFLSSTEAESADCLILDIHLGGMSGFDLQQRLAESGSRLPVISITADETTATRQRAQRANCSAFLLKPVEATPLIEAIHRAIHPWTCGARDRTAPKISGESAN